MRVAVDASVDADLAEASTTTKASKPAWGSSSLMSFGAPWT